MSANQINVFKRLLTDPSEEQIQKMIGFNPKKGDGMLINDHKLKLALQQELKELKHRDIQNF